VHVAETLAGGGRDITFVSGPEVMRKFVGESEEIIRCIFNDPPPPNEGFGEEARHVVVFDEFDAIARSRGGSGGKQGDAGVARDSVVNQLLSVIDGVERTGTFVVATTNRRELIDPALLRPGRLEIQVEIEIPDGGARREIFEFHTKMMFDSGRISGDYGGIITGLSDVTEGMSGAEIEGVCRGAASKALERVVVEFGDDEGKLLELCKVTEEDFRGAIEEVSEEKGRLERGCRHAALRLSKEGCPVLLSAQRQHNASSNRNTSTRRYAPRTYRLPKQPTYPFPRSLRSRADEGKHDYQHQRRGKVNNNHFSVDNEITCPSP